jgi:hypothetical protein
MKITNKQFDAALVSLMEQEPVESILRIPGVYEAVSEHFNNEAIDLATEAHADQRREHLRAVIANIALYGFLCYQDAPFNGHTTLAKRTELNQRRASARK